MAFRPLRELFEGYNSWLKTVDLEVASSKISENFGQELPAIGATINNHIGRPQAFFQKRKDCCLPADGRTITRADA